MNATLILDRVQLNFVGFSTSLNNSGLIYGDSSNVIGERYVTTFNNWGTISHVNTSTTTILYMIFNNYGNDTGSFVHSYNTINIYPGCNSSNFYYQYSIVNMYANYTIDSDFSIFNCTINGYPKAQLQTLKNFYMGGNTFNGIDVVLGSNTRLNNFSFTNLNNGSNIINYGTILNLNFHNFGVSAGCTIINIGTFNVHRSYSVSFSGYPVSNISNPRFVNVGTLNALIFTEFYDMEVFNCGNAQLNVGFYPNPFLKIVRSLATSIEGNMNIVYASQTEADNAVGFPSLYIANVTLPKGDFSSSVKNLGALPSTITVTSPRYICWENSSSTILLGHVLFNTYNQSGKCILYQPSTYCANYSSIIPPTVAPTMAPTSAPTMAPTSAPTMAPTSAPTKSPTLAPTIAPTSSPTMTPTSAPIMAPTSAPTMAPTSTPTISPTSSPTSSAPTESPVSAPTESPISTPTESPVSTPTEPPISTPTESPVSTPTGSPVSAPTESPISTPTGQPPTPSSPSVPSDTSSPSSSPSTPPTPSSPTNTVIVPIVSGSDSSFLSFIIINIVLILCILLN
eukprot:TRINITY_DN306_c0_g1_i4.p1 TRINITY_DN306_c0_g1~~TRINITY_DN306_c0_g1_i4.p1  ORF type:complete len:567 (-),score=94.81 TRINITY_DN306_c0_g1_i4:16-1716(-)